MVSEICGKEHEVVGMGVTTSEHEKRHFYPTGFASTVNGRHRFVSTASYHTTAYFVVFVFTFASCVA